MENQDPENSEMEKPPRPRKELRQGFSTGTAAAAVAQGALRELLGLPCPGDGGRWPCPAAAA